MIIPDIVILEIQYCTIKNNIYVYTWYDLYIIILNIQYYTTSMYNNIYTWYDLLYSGYCNIRNTVLQYIK